MSIESLLALAATVASQIAVAGQAMNIKTNIIHQTVHGRSLKSKKLANLLAEALGITVLAPPHQVYAAAHLGTHHRPDKVASLEDADVQFVRDLGFYPGMKVDTAWARFRTVLFSPRMHLKLLAQRLADNLLRGPRLRRLAALVWWAGIPTLAASHDLLGALLLAYVLPVTVFYQMAMITQALTEHRHFTHPVGDRSRNWHAAVSHARFLGAALPAAGLPLRRRLPAYGAWLMRMLGALILRVTVLPGELIVHSGHHWAPARADWTRAPYAYRDLKAGMPKEDIREFWGLRDVLDDVFRGIESSSE